MRIILYFGSFNPVHNGHINAAVNAMNQINASKLIFIPSFESFDDKQYQSFFVNAIDRYYMLKAAVSNINGFEVSDYEINQKRKVYTIETLKYYANKFYRDNLYILIGSDQIYDFYKWNSAYEILKIASIICYQRTNNVVNPNLYSKNDFLFLDHNANNISSTQVRKNKVLNYLPQAVLNYINNNGLYIDLRISSFISPKRFQHSLRVGLMAYKIMQKYDPKNAIKGWVAGAYHDIFKELGEQQTKKMMDKYDIESKLSWKVMHGIIAKPFLKEIFKFNDEMILNAIANHTIPNLDSKLTTLDKVLFCCDKLEPNRTDKDVKNIKHYRNLLEENLEQCFNELYDYQKFLFANKDKEKIKK